MISSDSHFFTNKEGVTVLERLKKILSNDTEYFNVIVGYFYSTGFYKLWKSLENVKKIKILVGMETDKGTFNALSLNGETSRETRERFKNKVKDEVATSPEKKEIEQGVIKFIEYIENGKLEIRAYPGKSLHAKVYIMLKKEGAEDKGKVITGSSNFTVSGLDENVEFNIELKDAPDIDFAEQKFEELWKKSIPVSEDYVETVTKHTHLNNKFTPYEIYLKTLYEYFKDRIDYNDIDVPEVFKKLAYQVDAVAQAKSILDSHNGVFLADVVGMGKTYIASMLAKEMNMLPLVICPPHLRAYWEETMHSFGVIPKVYSSGSLDKLIEQENLNKYQIVFIDEAHTFRNADTKRYAMLHEICAGKKVVLISATPLNNKPEDIANQIYLFENKYNSTIPNLPNLATYFTHLQREYDEIKKKYKDSNSISLRDIKRIADKMRNDVLKHLMIRRTRADIKNNYEEDMKKQHLTFPEIADPALAFYQLDTELNNLFDKSVKIIESPRDKKTSDKLFYARYMPLSYLKEDGKKYLLDSKQIESFSDLNFLGMSEELLVGIMRTFFLKRLDSSFYAFKKSLSNIIARYEKMIDMYDRGKVFISKKVDVYDYIERGEEEELEELLSEEDKGLRIPSEYFEKRFRTNLEKDLSKLKQLKNDWDKVKEDPKLDEIVDLLTNDSILGKEKLIIFTEFEDTEKYLAENIPLKNPSLKGKIVAISSKSNEKKIKDVLRNFDPNYPENNQEDDYRVLIATEVLSEGLNLNKAKAVVNYDIPWNPTRVIQRFGRINRVGTEGKIYIYNFFPTIKTDSKIHLREAAQSKMEMFINALGADAKYLTGKDTVKPAGLFKTLNSKGTYQAGEEETDEELPFLQEIRRIKNNNPELFKKIESIPVKARATRLKDKDAVLTYFKLGNLSKFFISDRAETYELAPADAMKRLKADENEKGLSLPEFYWDAFSKNESKFEEEIERNRVMSINNPIRGRSEAHLIKRVKALLNTKDVSLNTSLKDYLSSLLDALQLGAISSYAIKKAMKEVKGKTSIEDQVFAIERVISKAYIDNSMRHVKENKKKQIILSEIFMKEG